MTDESSRQPKKTEMIEVRVSHETKRDFLAACRGAGRSASDVVREAIQDFVEQQKRPFQVKEKRPLIMMIPRPIRKRGFLAGGAAAVVIGVFGLAPSFAQANMLSMFNAMDANSDGSLSVEEFAGPKRGEGVTVEKHISTSDFGDDPLPGGPKLTDESVAYWFPEERAEAGQTETRIELMQKRKMIFDGAPTDTLSMADIRKGVFAAFDRDADGRISFAEYEARREAMLTRGFDLLDKNGDKTLSSAEYAVIANPPMPPVADHNGPVPPPKAAPAPKASPETLKAAFAKLDANKDNKLSLPEYLPPS